MIPRSGLRYALLFVSLMFLRAVGAAASADYARLTPVPADQAIPLADFFRPPLLRSPSLSPDGTRIAGLMSEGDVRDRFSLMVYDTSTKYIDKVTGVGDKDIYWYTWLNDQRLAYLLSAQKLWDLGLFTADIGRLNATGPVLQYCLADFLGAPLQNRTKPLVWMRNDFEIHRDGGVVELNTDLPGDFIDLIKSTNYGVSADAIREQNTRHVTRSYPMPAGGIVTGYLCDKQGNLEFAFTAKDGVTALQRWDGSSWTKCPVDLDVVEVLAVGNRPGELVVLGPRQDGKPSAVQFMDARTGQMGTVLLQDSDYDFAGWFYRDPITREIVGAAYQRNGPHVTWFDDRMIAVQKQLNASFPPGQIVRVISRSEVGQRVVTMRYSDRQPPIYDWVDLETRKAGLIKNSMPWIDPDRMRPTQIMRFKTAEGKYLDAYLTLPAGAAKDHPVPLIVLPHGGPYARDDWGFDAVAQFLASRGYAVLKPNYRGSPGYGWKFPRNDVWDFMKMRGDVTAATKAALATKFIDPQRVAIMGGSFGGYLALCGLIDEPGLYRCAVAIDGVFDWGEIARDLKDDQYDNAQFGWMRRRIGDPKTNPELYERISPLRHVEHVHVPMFIAHGKEDQVVGVRQAKALIAALKSNNVPVESMLVADEGHGMAHVENQIELYSAIEAFLARHLTPNAATPAK